MLTAAFLPLIVMGATVLAFLVVLGVGALLGLFAVGAASTVAAASTLAGAIVPKSEGYNDNT